MKTQGRILFFLLSLFASIILGSSNSLLAEKIAIVDPSRFEEHSIYKAYQNRVINIQNSYKESFEDLKESLEKDLKSTSLDDAKKLQKRKEAQQRLEAEKSKVVSQVAVLKREIELKFEQAIQKEAKALGYDIVISKNFVFFGGDDITDEVLKRVQ